MLQRLTIATFVPAAGAGAPAAPSAPLRGRARLVGLLVPGAGQLFHGDVVGAFCVAIGTGALWLYAALELLVPNQAGSQSSLHLFEALAALRSPLTVLPDMVVTALLALALHIGAAVFAGSERFGRPVAR